MKMHQLLAVAKTRRKNANDDVNGAYHIIQKHGLFNGMSRTYEPEEDGGIRLPDESQKVQTTVSRNVATLAKALAGLFDTQLAIDTTNTFARADVIVDGVTLASRVPATHLLFLEKQLNDLYTVLSKLPTLDPTTSWQFDTVAELWKTPPVATSRIEKKVEPVVVVPPTDKHPAQVRDKETLVVVGTWTNTKLSGAVPEQDKRALLERVSKVQQAVKSAREQANSVEVEEPQPGTSTLVDFVLAGRLPTTPKTPGV